MKHSDGTLDRLSILLVERFFGINTKTHLIVRNASTSFRLFPSNLLRHPKKPHATCRLSMAYDLPCIQYEELGNYLFIRELDRLFETGR